VNLALWVVQILLALAFIVLAYSHTIRYDENRQTKIVWLNAVPRRGMFVIGTLELLGGIGLVLPAATRLVPVLTPIAATCLAALMVLAAIFHATRREYPNIVFNAVLGLLAAFVAYGRFVLEPIT